VYIALRDILAPVEIAEIASQLEAATFVDGLETAGRLAARVKRNLQLPQTDERGRNASTLVRRALGRSKAFLAAALPKALSEPRFNRYELGMEYGDHVDHALMGLDGKGPVMRSDLAATLFLSDPTGYDGGELVIGGHERVKLPAGDMALYPASTIHRVEPVTRGRRDAAILWIQSTVRTERQRELLRQLDLAVTALAERDPSAREVVALSAVYHNLLREWAEA
jgi:PKHD-type hydroxylase